MAQIVGEKAKLLAQTNVILRQVNAPKAEALIQQLHAILMPPPGEAREPVTMPDAVAAISAVLASIIMQQKPTYRLALISVIGNLIHVNMDGAQLMEACDIAATEAVAAERGTANGKPI